MKKVLFLLMLVSLAYQVHCRHNKPLQLVREHPLGMSPRLTLFGGILLLSSYTMPMKLVLLAT